mgnify:CR=1 FL=1
MNWITTNLRLPEDLYIELKMEAAQERKSVAAIIRNRLFVGRTRLEKDKLLKRLDSFGKKLAKNHPGLNLSKTVIDTRYER